VAFLAPVFFLAGELDLALFFPFAGEGDLEGDAAFVFFGLPGDFDFFAGEGDFFGDLEGDFFLVGDFAFFAPLLPDLAGEGDFFLAGEGDLELAGEGDREAVFFLDAGELDFAFFGDLVFFVTPATLFRPLSSPAPFASFFRAGIESID